MFRLESNIPLSQKQSQAQNLYLRLMPQLVMEGHIFVGVAGGRTLASSMRIQEFGQRPYIIETMHSYALPM